MWNAISGHVAWYMVKDWEFRIVKWDALANGFQGFVFTVRVECSLTCCFTIIICLKEEADFLRVMRYCSLEENLKPFDAAHFYACVDDRHSVQLMGLQPFLSIQINKIIKPQLSFGVTCPMQEVVLTLGYLLRGEDWMP